MKVGRCSIDPDPYMYCRGFRASASCPNCRNFLQFLCGMSRFQFQSYKFEIAKSAPRVSCELSPFTLALDRVVLSKHKSPVASVADNDGILYCLLILFRYANQDADRALRLLAQHACSAVAFECFSAQFRDPILPAYASTRFAARVRCFITASLRAVYGSVEVPEHRTKHRLTVRAALPAVIFAWDDVKARPFSACCFQFLSNATPARSIVWSSRSPPAPAFGCTPDA